VTRFGCAHESRREAVKLDDHRKSKANMRIKVCGRLEYLQTYDNGREQLIQSSSRNCPHTRRHT